MKEQVKEQRLQENFGKDSFHYDAKELLEPKKTVSDTSANVLEESESTTNAMKLLNESIVNVKKLQLLDKNVIVSPKLKTPIADLVVQQKKVTFDCR